MKCSRKGAEVDHGSGRGRALPSRTVSSTHLLHPPHYPASEISAPSVRGLAPSTPVAADGADQGRRGKSSFHPPEPIVRRNSFAATGRCDSFLECRLRKIAEPCSKTLGHEGPHESRSYHGWKFVWETEPTAVLA